MGGPGGARTMSEEEMRDMFGGGGGEDPVLGLLPDLLRRRRRGGEGRGRARAPRSQKGRDIESEAELTLEEAYHGAMRRISITLGGHARSIDVRIPPGVKDGSRVRAAGEGEAGSSGGASGDLFLRVRIKPHPVFERKGDDLYVKVALPVTTAVLGGEAQVPDDHRLGAAEGAGDDAARTDLPAEGTWHAARRQAGHQGRSLRDRSTSSSPAP